MSKLRTCVPVSIGIPYDLLTKIDEIAAERNLSRSSFVVKVLEEKLEQENNQI